MEEGKRFSQVYLERGTPARDSARFRNRVSAYYWQNLHGQHKDKIRTLLQKETGAEVPFVAGGYSVAGFFKKAELRDVLDAITLIYQHLIASGWKSLAGDWKTFIERAFQEENIGYRLDRACGVHYYVDEEFERNRFSTLAVLEEPRYSGVKAAFDDAYRHLDSDPPDTKAAVRSTFESLEILVKQMVETKNLNKWVVENTLKNKCLKLFQDDPTAAKVVAEFMSGLACWVDGLHNYRHGQAAEEPVSPNEEVAVYILSSGSAHLRLLINLNNRLGKGSENPESRT